MSLPALSITKLFNPVAKIAKSTSSMTLLCLRMHLYSLACISLTIIGAGIYFLISLYLNYQDSSNLSQKLNNSIMHVKQNYWEPNVVQDNNSARPLTKFSPCCYTITSVASNSTKPIVQNALPSTTSFMQPISSMADLNDPKNITRDRLANFGLRPKLKPLAHNTTPALNLAKPSFATTTAQSTTTFSTSTTTTNAVAHSHVPFTVLTALQHNLKNSSESYASLRLSVTERIAANTQAVDKRVNAIITQHELKRQTQTQSLDSAQEAIYDAIATDISAPNISTNNAFNMAGEKIKKN